MSQPCPPTQGTETQDALEVGQEAGREGNLP